MNIVQIAGCAGTGQAAAERDLLVRSLLFNESTKELFIKLEDGLYPVGGMCKQNTLIPGSNIEIHEAEYGGTVEQPVIRLADDLYVKTVHLQPELDVPEWAGTIKLGELNNYNSVLLLTKATAVEDDVQGLIGGELLVKMIDDNDEEIMASYNLTLTSTGSWSLWGGTTLGTNIRVCAAQYNDAHYYGLKLPDVDRPVTTTQIVTHASRTDVNLHFQVGTRDSRTLYIGRSGQGNTSLLLTRASAHIPNQSDYNYWYTVPIRRVVQNLQGISTAVSTAISDAIASGSRSDLKTWYDNDYYLAFWIYANYGTNNVNIRIYNTCITNTPAKTNFAAEDVVAWLGIEGMPFIHWNPSDGPANVGRLFNQDSVNIPYISFTYGGQDHDGHNASNQAGSYCMLGQLNTAYTTETITTTYVRQVMKSAEFWFNGWYDVPESLRPVQFNTHELSYQVLARESQDADSFAEIITPPTNTTVTNSIQEVQRLQQLGEDAPPYKLVYSGRTLTKADLRTIANACKDPDRQIYLDLSGCTMANGQGNLDSAIFESCTSLRGIKMPAGVTSIDTGIFIWCTYLRELDLTASASSLTRIGFPDGSYNSSIGILTSTRVRTVLVPRTVNTFGGYVSYSSNITNFIMLHRSTNNWPAATQRAFGGTPLGGQDTYSGVLPAGFHCFVEEGFFNRHPTDYTWGNTGGWYTQDFVASIVRFRSDWSVEQWQSFNDTYQWGEELINIVRREFGATQDIEIIDR